VRELLRADEQRLLGERELLGEVPERKGELGGVQAGRVRGAVGRVRAERGEFRAQDGVLAREEVGAVEGGGGVEGVPLELERERVRLVLRTSVRRLGV
jgi:hypothetical protein